MKFDKLCGFCNSYKWCGRQCLHYEKESKGASPKPEQKPPPAKKSVAPIEKPLPKKKAKRKPPNSIRFPQEVLEFFRHDEPGWQRRICEALLKIARGE